MAKKEKPEFNEEQVKGWTAKEWDAYFKDYKKCDWPHIKYYVVNKKKEYEDTLREDIIAGKSFKEVKDNFYGEYFPNYIVIPKVGDGMLDWADPDAARAKKKEQQAKARERAKAKKAAEVAE